MSHGSAETLPRYKRPKAFAIRHFPRGCSPHEVKLSTKPVEQASSVVGLENVKLTGSENYLEANPEHEKLEVRELVRESSELSKFLNRHCSSKIYGSPKRRKVFSIRQFPPGCGPSSEIINKDLLKAKNLVGKKIDEASKHLVGYNTLSVAATEIFEEQMRMNDEIEAVTETIHGICRETGIRPQISSMKYKFLDGEKKKPDSKQQEMVGCSALIKSSGNNLLPMKNMTLVKQPIVMHKPARAADAEKHLNHEKSMVKQEKMADSSVKVAFSEKACVEDRNDSDISKGKAKNFGKCTLVRSNTDKNFYGSGTQGNSSHVQIKSSLKCGSKEIFGRSISDKTLGGCKGYQTNKNLQIKENAGSSSHVVVKSTSASELLDNDGNPLVGKYSVNECEITSDSLKRKLSAEFLFKDYIPDEGEDFLEAYGERMINQALLAAENCTLRNSKRFSAVGSGSGFVQSKIKKEKSVVDRNYASKVFSSSQQKNKGLIKDIDHLVGADTSWKEIAAFKKHNEFSVTMTPFKLSQKGSDNEEVLARHRVKRALRIFQLICRKLLRVEESSSKKLGKINRVDLQACKVLKDNGEWVSNGEPIMGHVHGVEVGDEFHYRVELSLIGLHRLFQGGIDSMKQNRMLVAVSIVASGGYEDDVDGSDVLIYSGSGGISAGGDKQPGDQKLERGNLALKNSIEAQTPVRVILGFKEKSDPHDARGKLVSTFTYAGLYHVESYWQERGSHGFNVFKFQLKRKPGQPELAFKELKRSTMLRIREGLCVEDITRGKEKIPISVINTIDTDCPTPFKYITKNIYPSCYVKIPPRGCDCIGGCSDSEKCACAIKNGGENPYNCSGAIVQAKSLIYECGPSCKCPLSCYNRVGQHGIRMPLEVFKTRGRGWGVRSLKSISSGSFICEYIGELLQDGEAEQRTNDEYLFDIGHNYDDRSLWEDLPNLIPELQSNSICDTVENVGFTIDAAEYGNIGRFINHSCSPNLYAQNVLYDHDDKRIPHIMFFAVDNIPPLQELTYHYNYTIDQVRDSEGNIKQKACYCGSHECRGRLY
ncbi:hypothetical protein IEQ34_011053 [Dendrobium chrysotoxum]|uniref:Uncharacterized protein n=1 Tax=Dendrobium chrysotoxum TaxID=161865 RepID=A0AAV7GWE4_DENCH|nr:hypothetical protein IEQ34_011053 [Dendrobium chrysotoxum]